MRAIADPARLGVDPPDDPPMFLDRDDAGKQLAAALATYERSHPVVLGLARGGVPVAAAVAEVLKGDLDVAVVRKLGAPISDELAIGAVSATGHRVVNTVLVRKLGISREYLDRITKRRTDEARALEQRLRRGAPAIDVRDRTVLLVDDGLATGASMLAAARAVRDEHPRELVIAVPVGSREACEVLRAEADNVVCLSTPEPFWAVGVYYRDFSQTDDGEVQRLLEQARSRRAPTAPHTAFVNMY